MWTPISRQQHRRASLRYEADLPNAEWAVIKTPMPRPASRGWPSVWAAWDILNAIVSDLRGDIAWRLIPEDLPSRSAAFVYLSWRQHARLFGRVNHHLFMADRENVG